MSTNYKSRKVSKKQKRCEAIILKDYGIESSETPTQYLAILNAGLCTGLTEEQVVHAVTRFGEIMKLEMLSGKSYCFLSCPTINDAVQIMQGLHNVALLGQKEAVIYLSYFKQLPVIKVNSSIYPDGLICLNDFISMEEEQMLLSAVTTDNAENVGALKHRAVKHFGYEFLYNINNVDPNEPLKQKIPSVCDFLWPRLHEAIKNCEVTMEWQVPDQLTVNEYLPGQGIPSHVDTHSAFLNPIVSVSLESDIVMEFRKGQADLNVILPRRSLLIMSGETRYDWLHGITPRSMDVVPTASGTLTTKMREKRTSLTFRHLRRGDCTCNYPTLCDTKLKQQEAQKSLERIPNLISDAIVIEQKNVHNVYEQIAKHFSATRHTPWPQVAEFLNSFTPGDVVLDIGCGNGKYLSCNQQILTIGCDRSQLLLNNCIAKTKNMFRCDCLSVPVRDQVVDGCISIAVIHHLATNERRLAALREMTRLLCKGGRALVYVWAKNQKNDAKKSSYLLQNKAVNKHKITEAQQRQITEQQQQQRAGETDALTQLPVHTNRTNFLQQDVLVPWKLKNDKTNDNNKNEDDDNATTTKTFLRYYHVFEAGELEALVAQVNEVQLIKSYYDQGNHCVIFQRK